MALARSVVPQFQIGNNAYIGAVVTFYVANPDGTASATLATLYADLTGVATLANPQQCDSTGKFLAPVYIDTDVVGSVAAGGGSGSTGVIQYGGSARGVYATATRYFTHDRISGPSGQVPDVEGNLYESNAIFDSTNWAADVANLTLILDFQALVVGTLPLATIAQAKAGTSTSTAVTPDDLAAFWQQGSDIASAATLAKPADANLGGVHRVTGNVNIDNHWAGSVDGEEIELRYTGTPNITVAGNLLPPNSAAYQIIAGDMIRWRWDATAAKWRAYGGMRADGTALIAAINGNTYLSKAADYDPVTADNGGHIDFSAAAACVIPNAATFRITISNSAASGDVTISMSGGNLDGLATRLVRPGDTVTIQGTGAGGKTINGRYSYDSGQQTITLGAVLNLGAHGLGVVPQEVRVTIECISADLNYAVGDVVDVPPTIYNGFENNHYSLRQDATNLKLNVAANRIAIINASTLALGSIDITKWKWRVRAWTRK